VRLAATAMARKGGSKEWEEGRQIKKRRKK
jgi:hypothetical protein